MIPARFIRRDNRFVARVELAGEETTVYVPNTGRCEELLFEGNQVYLKDHEGSSRKYRYSIEGVKKEDYWLSINSSMPNQLFKESYLKGELDFLGLEGELEAEVSVSSRSRLDFKIGEAYLEIKGVTLDVKGKAYFPDAPTERGIRHLQELSHLAQSTKAYLIYIVLTRSQSFAPNPKDRAYTKAFWEAYEKGVKCIALAYEGFPRPVFKGVIPLEGEEMKRIQTIYEGDKKTNTMGCGECQTSCQSACKTSCTVGNQGCEQK